jgi:hypothetical protein
MIPSLFSNLRKALLPLMHDETYEAMKKVNSLVESLSNSNNNTNDRNSSKRNLEDVNANDNIVDNNEEQDSTETKKIRSDNIPSECSINTCSEDSAYCVPCYELL